MIKKLFAVFFAFSVMLVGCTDRSLQNSSTEPSLNEMNSISSNPEENENTAEDETFNSSEQIQMQIEFHWGGYGEDPHKTVTLICPSEWSGNKGTDSQNGKKILEFVCYDEESIQASQSLPLQIANGEKKELGNREFTVVSEEHAILEKPNWENYQILSYFFENNGYICSISFFKNINEPAMEVSEFEEILETMKL